MATRPLENEGVGPLMSLEPWAVSASCPVAPRRKPPSGTLRGIVVAELAWPCSCSGWVHPNVSCPCATFIIKNGCLNVPSIPCPRASKWSLHWPAGPRRNHRAPPYRHSHRPPPTAKTPNWHLSLEYMSGVSRPAQEAFRFGVFRPWSSGSLHLGLRRRRSAQRWCGVRLLLSLYDLSQTSPWQGMLVSLL